MIKSLYTTSTQGTTNYRSPKYYTKHLNNIQNLTLNKQHTHNTNVCNQLTQHTHTTTNTTIIQPKHLPPPLYIPNHTNNNNSYNKQQAITQSTNPTSTKPPYPKIFILLLYINFHHANVCFELDFDLILGTARGNQNILVILKARLFATSSNSSLAHLV